MPESVPSVTIKEYDQDAKGSFHFIAGLIVFAAGDYTTGGINIYDKIKAAIPGVGALADACIDMFVHGIAGYLYEFDKASGKLLIRQCAAAGNPQAQLTGAAALPGGVTGDTITFLLLLRKFF